MVPPTPNLFIIGAMKCGTTSLHNYLDEHPSISMSTIKEPNIFVGPRWRDDVSRYGRLLDGDAPIRGESSTNYAKYPLFADVPPRIASVAPDATLVYLVRDPLSRCLSQWVHNVGQGREPRDLDDAIRDFEDPQNSYVWSGRYATQLERYLEHFPLERVLVVDQAKLRSEREATIRTVFRFLGVEDGFTSPEFAAEFHKGERKRRLGPVAARIRRSQLKVIYERLPASVKPAAGWMRRRIGTPIDRPRLDPALKAELLALYDDELARLEALTGVRPTAAS